MPNIDKIVIASKEYPIIRLTCEPDKIGEVLSMTRKSTEEKALAGLERKLKEEITKSHRFPAGSKIVVYPIDNIFEAVVTDRYMESIEGLKRIHLKKWLTKKGKSARKILREELGMSRTKVELIENYEDELLKYLDDKPTREFLGYKLPMLPKE